MTKSPVRPGPDLRRHPAYVVRVDHLATADADTLAPLIGPSLQRYLTGQLP